MGRGRAMISDRIMRLLASEVFVSVSVLGVLVGLAVGQRATVETAPEAEPAGGAPECSVDCPPGTRVASFSATSVTEDLTNGTFVLFRGECETRCAPIEECFPPNIPVVTENAFRCDTVPGFSDIEPAADVDFSFADVWDAAQAQPVPDP